ncbi:S1C family serine protease [Aerosticca soli]|uniref:Outer membrane stress sensor protease DegS n=1 Tax=Aerosticca soli TaxID=2010829 RepID=A0A2Z6E6A7_9GAMM|nr:trypsin-like peptidase domain-containing protein [Aerosticca soli]BBD80088.1 outer membrane stress sensor protease DegS [Aerosticca soli]
MRQVAGILAFFARFAVIGLAAAFLISLIWPSSGDRLRSRLGWHAAPQTTVAAATAPVSYADAVARAAPSVVNIYANRMVTEQAIRMYADPLLQRLLGGVPAGPAYRRTRQVLGSGVIVSRQGYVLTNNHVIAKADDIQVLLYDGRVARATLVGADEETDLAVLRIDAGNLPVIQMADPKSVRAGDIALAIGNPLGLNQTVTMGIVSATGRQLDSNSPEDFIQTDAAINFGNSGGALINAHGELIGINALLIGKEADAEGIGFAIPASNAKKVLDQIVASGHVVRGWLGADYGFVPIAANSGLPAAARGAQIVDVYPGGPAAQAGLKQHDILLEVDGHDIRNPADLRRIEADLTPGRTVEVAGLRNGSPFQARVGVTRRPPPTPAP